MQTQSTHIFQRGLTKIQGASFMTVSGLGGIAAASGVKLRTMGPIFMSLLSTSITV